VSHRHCFALDLVDDAALIQEYRRMHEPGNVWPEVIDHIRARGVKSMEIWQRGDRLYMVLEAADDYPRDVSSEPTQLQNDRWETYMSTFQRVLADVPAGEKWAPMRCVFVLADHKGRSQS
jgi:L-rhamnose mutarotase